MDEDDMRIVLGISARSDEVTAALVDVDLPEYGPVDERTTPMQIGSPAEVAAAVATSIGVMRLRATRADLLLTGAAVVLDSASLRAPVEAALLDGHIRDVVVVDAVDVDPSFEPAVAVALWAYSDSDSGDAIAGPIPVVLPEPADTSAQETRRGFAVVGAGVAAAVLAGSFAVWAVTGVPAPEAAGIVEPAPAATADSSEAGDGIAPNPAAPAGSSPTAIPEPVPGDGPPADAFTGATAPSGTDAILPAAPAGSAPGATTRPRTGSSAPSTDGSTDGSAGGGSTSGGSSGGSTPTGGGTTTGGTTTGGTTTGGTTTGGGPTGGSGSGGTDPGSGTGGSEDPGSTGGSSPAEEPTDGETPSTLPDPDTTPTEESGTAFDE